MLGDMLIRVMGHALARTIFKESPEDAAKRIAEEQRQLAEKKRKEREDFLRALPFVVIFLMAIGFILYLIWQANK